MKHVQLLILGCLLYQVLLFSQKQHIISKEDLAFLKDITRSVMDSSRIQPGQRLTAPFGANNTGGTLIRPGGRNTYPSFWIRDYAMSLETGFITREEQKHMLLLTAGAQCDQTWITKGGSMVPFGAIADHIRIDNSLPVYFPGTYDVEAQGTKDFGIFPPYCDQFYFVQMAYYYIKTTSDIQLLLKDIHGIKLIDRLEIAFRVPPARKENQVVYTTENLRGVDFGFRDAIEITGDLAYASLLKYTAANQMAELFGKIGNLTKAEQYRSIASQIKTAIPGIFIDKKGMLLASTGKSAQPDVWGTALAVYLGVLEGEKARKACRVLADSYANGTLTYKGSVRHIIKGDDFNEKTAWEGALPGVSINQYQNGAYWGTPVGWVAYAIAQVNSEYAKRLVKEFIMDLKATDFRKGPSFQGPMECFYPPSEIRGPVYLATVACPYIVFQSMENIK